MKKDVTTIHDVARRLGLSATTVWRAVHHRPRVSEKTRERVLKAVNRYNYRPSLTAQAMRGRSQTLGVVVPTIANPIFARLVRAVEKVAMSRGYNILLCDTDFELSREAEHFDLLLRRRTEGVILVPFVERSAKQQRHVDELARRGIPLVAMQQRLVGRNVAQVIPDNVAAAAMATRHLLSLGHRRIAFAHCGVSARLIAFHERYRGYLLAMREAGIVNDTSLIAQVAKLDPRTPGIGPCNVNALSRLLRDGQPTAIFAPADVIALQLMTALRSMGIRVPGDVAMIGFDDIQMANHAAPPLTTIGQPTEQVGTRAAELLFDTIGGATLMSVTERIPCQLIVRESCGSAINGM